MKKPFHLMAKPTSFQCNLSCEYCFYLPKGKDVLQSPSPKRHMDDAVLRQYIKQYIENWPTEEIMFAWQGGEPTLAGLDFYRRVLALQSQYGKGRRIHNSLQTNGVLLNDAWAAFLAENHFLVGISVDGPRSLHDRFRKSNSGQSVFRQVIDGIERLRKHEVEFNLLAVVNSETAKYPREVYHFLTRELACPHVQFIPIVEPAAAAGAGQQFGELICRQNGLGETVMPWSVNGDAYGKFMISVFDQWVRQDVGRVFVQLFDNTLAAWAGETPSLCVMQPTCGRALIIEQNGDIYSCDHFVTPEHRLGNIMTTPLSTLAYGKQQKKFSRRKTPSSPACQRCDYRFVCQGGCPKHRIIPLGNQRQNYLCSGYKAFFQHVAPYMTYMAEQIAQRRSPANVMNVAAFIAANQVASQAR
ncbi:anaerobic sulfatase maturase [Brenneria corticis]|uniref:Anaerobic sulfatase maturase n=1 Tax=Brenneria corticis TaxID=2173106 RepID=A0A2U1TVE5_9GAMM|nr:anaerobic sulfatase maturase [Brenneria sp. CFCC 11842]PWC13364.1 anaerobic sulfatase maturase [Brenneria sp. CFCC 11842]